MSRDLGMMETPKPMQGTWTLTAPDGRKFMAASPLHCVRAEMDERVPPSEQLARVLAVASEPDFAERHLRLAEFYRASDTVDLIDKLDAHVAKQVKFAKHEQPFSFAPQRVREG